jgi:hypothetical protein
MSAKLIGGDGGQVDGGPVPARSIPGSVFSPAACRRMLRTFCPDSYPQRGDRVQPVPLPLRLDQVPGHPGRAGLAEGILPGSGAIVPIAHRTSVFELTPAEWADTRDLLLQARMALHDLLARTAV